MAYPNYPQGGYYPPPPGQPFGVVHFPGAAEPPPFYQAAEQQPAFYAPHDVPAGHPIHFPAFPPAPTTSAPAPPYYTTSSAPAAWSAGTSHFGGGTQQGQAAAAPFPPPSLHRPLQPTVIPGGGPGPGAGPYAPTYSLPQAGHPAGGGAGTGGGGGGYYPPAPASMGHGHVPSEYAPTYATSQQPPQPKQPHYGGGTGAVGGGAGYPSSGPATTYPSTGGGYGGYPQQQPQQPAQPVFAPTYPPTHNVPPSGPSQPPAQAPSQTVAQPQQPEVGYMKPAQPEFQQPKPAPEPTQSRATQPPPQQPKSQRPEPVQPARVATSEPAQPAVKEPVPVNLDIDREFADIKSTGPTSVHAAVLNNCKTFARLGKGLIEYILENFDALSKGDSKVQAMVNQSISTLKATADKTTGLVRQEMVSLTDKFQLDFLTTSLESLEQNVTFFLDNAGPSNFIGHSSARPNLLKERDALTPFLQSFILSANGLLLASEMLGDLKKHQAEHPPAQAQPQAAPATRQEPKPTPAPIAIATPSPAPATQSTKKPEQDPVQQGKLFDTHNIDLGTGAPARATPASPKPAPTKLFDTHNIAFGPLPTQSRGASGPSSPRGPTPAEASAPSPAAVHSPPVQTRSQPISAQPSPPPQPSPVQTPPQPAQAKLPSHQTQPSSSAGGQKPEQMSGYLLKQGEKGLVKSWKRRYFHQQDNLIHYSASDKSGEQPLGHIDIAAIQKVAPGPKVRNGFNFDIFTSGGRVYHLQAAKNEEQLRWMTAIEAWMTRLKGGGASALATSPEELKKQLAETEKQITSAATSAAGLEKLMGYYANDPVAKKKAQDELEALKQKATELRERKRLILEKLKAESAPSPAPSSESASSGTADEQKKEILESELKTLKEMLRKQSTAATGLEKLVGFYASDPQQQQKTMAELQEMKGKIEELKTRQKQITVELKEIKDKAASQKAPALDGAWEAEALYDWSEELSFRAGDILVVEEQLSEEWYSGHVKGSSAVGAFPVNYVKLLSPSRPTQAAAPQTDQPASASAAPAAALRYGQALYDFKAEHEGELGMQAGDIILLVDSQADSEWWRGELNGTTGSFPSNYVELLQEQQQPAAPVPTPAPVAPSVTSPETKLIPQTAAALHQPSTSQPPTRRAEVLYDFHAQSDVELSCAAGAVVGLIDYDPSSEWVKAELRGTVGSIPTSYVRVLEDAPAAAIPSAMPPAAAPVQPQATTAGQPPSQGSQGQRQVKALYDFVAENEGELGFKAGDVINLASWSDAEWWTGEVGGAHGAFPASYVEAPQ